MTSLSSSLPPMSGFRSPLDAYREDLSRAPGRRRLAAGDEFWLILATGLRRLAQAPVRSRPAAARRLSTALVALANEHDRKTTKRPARQRTSNERTGSPSTVAAALTQFPSAEHAHALVAEVRGAAADAEEAGAVELAREVLTDLVELSSHAPALDRGGVLLQLGRIARTLGDLDAALDMLHAAGAIGRECDVPELVTRESLGEAVVARTRGNYPAARRHFETALEGAKSLGLADVKGMAHQGLMIVAAESGDFDAALTHGWDAVSAARAEGARLGETLCNLSHLCAKAGYDAAAARGFLAALARTTAPRVRLPALAGLAVSAGRLGDARRVDYAEQAINTEATDAFPFETAGAWFAISRARQSLGDSNGSAAAATKAAAIAHLHGYNEITHRIERSTPVVRVPLADTGMGVIRSLEAWSDAPTPELLTSSAPTD
jgi:tetratricopeptide (TPR) repeat protein